MYSADFFRKYRQLLQADEQRKIASGEITIATGGQPLQEGEKKGIGTRIPHWARSQTQDVQRIVYDVLTGKAYPNPNEARKSGVVNFSYQVPSGMNVDWSWWDKFKTPERTVAAEVPLTDIDVTADFTPSTAKDYPLPDPVDLTTSSSSDDSDNSNDNDTSNNDDEEEEEEEEPEPEPEKKYTPVKVASLAEWTDQATYFGGKLEGQKVAEGGGPSANLERYYKNYVKEINKANRQEKGNKARAINRIHKLTKTTTKRGDRI